MDPAIDLTDDKQPKGEPLKTEPVKTTAASTNESDDEGPPALEEGVPERPDEDVDEDEVAAAATHINPRIANLELNKKHDVFRLNLAHQETDRILGELEANCEAVIDAGGVDAWIPVPGLESFICNQLGYADTDEFEDALGGTFEEFLNTLPHIESRQNNEESRMEIRMRKPEGDGRGFIKKLRIKKSEDLWRTLYKAPGATLTIPQMEFQIGGSEKRELDAIFNHISTAMFNLSTHVSNGQVEGEQKEGILDCVEQLSKYLDIEEEWDLILTDPSGKSIFKPDDGIENLPLDPAGR